MSLNWKHLPVEVMSHGSVVLLICIFVGISLELF